MGLSEAVPRSALVPPTNSYSNLNSHSQALIPLALNYLYSDEEILVATMFLSQHFAKVKLKSIQWSRKMTKTKKYWYRQIYDTIPSLAFYTILTHLSSNYSKLKYIAFLLKKKEKVLIFFIKMNFINTCKTCVLGSCKTQSNVNVQLAHSTNWFWFFAVHLCPLTYIPVFYFFKKKK